MPRTGRPKKEIKKEQFEGLCMIQCTQEEICAVLGVCEDTLQAWCKKTYHQSFSEVFRQKRQGGKASLRRMQWRLAERNPSMAIFLGKNMLGQSDRIQTSVSVTTDDDPITKALKESGIIDGSK